MNLHEGAERVRALADRITQCATPPPELMPELLEEARAMLIGRTLANHDKYGGDFESYAPYSRRPIEIGGVHYKDGYYQYKAEKFSSPQPNLRVTGDMFAAIETNVIDAGRGQLTISGEAATIGADLENGTSRMNARPWWGIGLIAEELQRMKELVSERVRAAVVRIINGNA